MHGAAGQHGLSAERCGDRKQRVGRTQARYVVSPMERHPAHSPVYVYMMYDMQDTIDSPSCTASQHQCWLANRSASRTLLSVTPARPPWEGLRGRPK